MTYQWIEVESKILRLVAETRGWRTALERASLHKGMFWSIGNAEQFIALCGDLMPRRPRVTR